LYFWLINFSPAAAAVFMSSSSSCKALEFLFFVAEINDEANSQDLLAASILAESKLRKGSRIDVWADGKFWAARIKSTNKQGFVYRYCCKFGRDGGFVNRRHFQSTWRFPVESARQVVFAEALGKFTDPGV
jgi:hypothetical protein